MYVAHVRVELIILTFYFSYEKENHKIIFGGCIVMSAFQSTSADCILRNGSNANGYCKDHTSNGYTHYSCEATSWTWWQTCNVGDSSTGSGGSSGTGGGTKKSSTLTN
jgi:hypothetical protein